MKCVHIYTAYIEVRWLKTSFDRRLFVRKTKRTAFSHRVIYTLCVYNFGCCCCDFLYDSTIQRLAYGQIVNNLFYWQRFCANRRIRYMNMGYWFKSLNMLQDMFTFQFFLVDYTYYVQPLMLLLLIYRNCTVRLIFFTHFGFLNRMRLCQAHSSIRFPLKLTRFNQNIEQIVVDASITVISYPFNWLYGLQLTLISSTNDLLRNGLKRLFSLRWLLLNNSRFGLHSQFLR